MRLPYTAAADANGAGHKPVHILQLTHSGRYSRPEGHIARPLVPQHDPILDQAGNETIVTDAYLDALTERYVQSALLAKEAGFDGVDIKSCHRYLLSELLASHTWPGKYGGSFANMSRFLRQTIQEVRKAVGEDFIVACLLPRSTRWKAWPVYFPSRSLYRMLPGMFP